MASRPSSSGALAMAAAPRRRLRVKTRIAKKTAVVNNSGCRKRSANVDKKETNPSRTTLRQAVFEGLLPKARSAYALFTQHMTKCRGARPGRGSARDVAQAWATLSPEDKREWLRKATLEKDQQFEAASAMGIVMRYTKRRVMAQRGLTRNARTRRASGTGLTASTTTVSSGTIFEAEGQVFTVECQVGARPLGRGSYGKVMKAVQKTTGRVVALKVFEGALDKVEIMIYNQLAALDAHPCLLRVIMCNMLPPTPWMALPFVPTGSLRTHLRAHGKFSDLANILAVAYQLGQGLFFLHSHNILHLDVKPDNVLWDQATREVKLVDFGLAERADPVLGVPRPRCQVYCTACYRAPELWTYETNPSMLRPAVDVWSYGCTIYEVAVNRPLLAPVDRHGVVVMTESTSQLHLAVKTWCNSWKAKKGSDDQRYAMERCRRAWCIRHTVWFCCAPCPEQRPKLSDNMENLMMALHGP